LSLPTLFEKKSRGLASFLKEDVDEELVSIRISASWLSIVSTFCLFLEGHGDVAKRGAGGSLAGRLTDGISLLTTDFVLFLCIFSATSAILFSLFFIQATLNQSVS
jgi:hypothetical protein